MGPASNARTRAVWWAVVLVGLARVVGACDGYLVRVVAEFEGGYVVLGQFLDSPSCPTSFVAYFGDLWGQDAISLAIHTNPLKPQLDGVGQCEPAHTGGVFDPLGSAASSCTDATPDDCAVGDLAGRAGTIERAQVKFSLATIGAVPLTGEHSVVGRPLVVSSVWSGLPLACATLRYETDLAPTSLTATFTGSVLGSVSFHHALHTGPSTSFLDLQLEWASGNSSATPWLVAEASTCSGGAAAPAVFHPGLCDGCVALGNLSWWVGDAWIGATGNMATTRLHHPEMVLSWGMSVENHALVLLDAEGGVVDCAVIEPDLDCTIGEHFVSATLSGTTTSGEVRFSQPRLGCPTLIQANLTTDAATVDLVVYTNAALGTVVQGSASGLACSSDTPWDCAFGELSQKWAWLGSVGSPRLVGQWYDWTFPLFGSSPLHFRYLAVVGEGSVLASARIFPESHDTLDASTSLATVTFVGHMPGFEELTIVRFSPPAASGYQYSYGLTVHALSVPSNGECGLTGRVLASDDAPPPDACSGDVLLRFCERGDLWGKFGAKQTYSVMVDNTLDFDTLPGHSVGLTRVQGDSVTCATIGGESYRECQAYPTSTTGSLASESVNVGFWRAVDQDLFSDYRPITSEERRLTLNFQPFHPTKIQLVGLGFEQAKLDVWPVGAQPQELPVPAAAGSSVITMELAMDQEVDRVDLVIVAGNDAVVTELAVFTECFSSTTPTGIVPGEEALSVEISGPVPDNDLSVFTIHFSALSSFTPNDVDAICPGAIVQGPSPVPDVLLAPYSHPCATLCPEGGWCDSNNPIDQPCWEFLWGVLQCDAAVVSSDDYIHLSVRDALEGMVGLVANGSEDCREDQGPHICTDGISVACVQGLFIGASCSEPPVDFVDELLQNMPSGVALEDAMLEAVMWSAINRPEVVERCYDVGQTYTVTCELVEGSEVSIVLDTAAITTLSGSALQGEASFLFVQDTLPPAVVSPITLSTTNPSGTHARPGDTIAVSVCFSETVSASVLLFDAEPDAWEWNDNHSCVNTSTVVRADMAGDAVVTIDAVDASGNSLTSGYSLANHVVILNTPPTVAGSLPTANTYIVSSPATIHLTFSTSVEGMGMDALVLGNCTNPALDGPISNILGVVLYWLGCEVQHGMEVSVVVKNVVTDLAGNAMASNLFVVMPDLERPSISLGVSAGPCDRVGSSAVALTITASEPVSIANPGTAREFFSAGWSVLSALPAAAPNQWVVTFAVPSSFSAGVVEVQCAEGLLQDAAGWNNTASDVVTFVYGREPAVTAIELDETEDPFLYDTVLGAGDVVKVEFGTHTNSAGVCAECSLELGEQAPDGACDTVLDKDWIDTYLWFTESIGSNYTAQWEDCDKLVITIHNSTGLVDATPLAAFAQQPALACDDPANFRNIYHTSPSAAQRHDDVVDLEVSLGSCAHGSVGADYKCVCDQDYIGAGCDVPCAWDHMLSTEDERIRGVCTCESGYFGDCSIFCDASTGSFFSEHPSLGANVCVCDPGYVGTSCDVGCGPGSYASPAATCVGCPAGYYSAGEANEACSLCPEGTFMESQGATECSACPDNTETRATGVETVMDCFPSQGYFRAGSSLQSQFSVVACEQPLKCRYWWDTDYYNGGVLTDEDVTEKALWCDDIGYFGSCLQCRCDEGNANITNADKECYTGYLCGRCRQGYYTVGTACQRCPASSVWLTVVLCLLFLLVLTFFYKAAPYMDATGSVSIFFNFFQLIAFYQYFNVRLPKALKALLDILSFFTLGLQLMQPECQQEFFRHYENRFVAVLLLPVIVALFFLGLFLYQVGYKTAKFQFFFRREVRVQRRLSSLRSGTGGTSGEGDHMASRPSLFRDASLRTKMLHGGPNPGGEPDAVQPSGQRGSVFRAQMTAKHLQDPVATAAMLNVRKRFEGESKQERGRRGTRFREILNAASLREGIADITNVQNTVDMCVNGFMTFLSLVYLMLVLQILSVFDCTYRSDVDQYRLDAEPTIECFVWSGPYRTLIVGASVGLVVYVIGIPALFAFVLINKRRHLESWRIKSRYGFLYQRFARSWFWWELVVELRKFLFVFLQLFTDYYVHFSISCSLLVVFGALCVHTYAMPYASDILNRLEFVLLVGNFVVLLALLQLVDDEFNKNQGEALGYVVVGIVLLLTLLCAKVFWVEVRRRANDATVTMSSHRAKSMRCCGGVMEKERLKREKLVQEVRDMSSEMMDERSAVMLDSWVVHNASFAELEIWLAFMQKFRKFEKRVEHVEDITEYVPALRDDKAELFWAWLSKARQQDIVNLSRALAHIRLFKRWQSANEKRVQRFVVDQIREMMVLNADLDELPLVQRRWAILRRTVITGRWRRLSWDTDKEVDRLNAPAWFRSAVQSLPQKIAAKVEAKVRKSERRPHPLGSAVSFRTGGEAPSVAGDDEEQGGGVGGEHGNGPSDEIVLL